MIYLSTLLPTTVGICCRFNHMNSLRDVPEHVLREITNFFEVRREREGDARNALEAYCTIHVPLCTSVCGATLLVRAR